MYNENIVTIRSRYDDMIDGMEDYLKEMKSLPEEEQKKRAIKNLHAIGIMDENGNLVEGHPLRSYIRQKEQ